MDEAARLLGVEDGVGHEAARNSATGSFDRDAREGIGTQCSASVISVHDVSLLVAQ